MSAEECELYTKTVKDSSFDAENNELLPCNDDLRLNKCNSEFIQSDVIDDVIQISDVKSNLNIKELEQSLTNKNCDNENEVNGDEINNVVINNVCNNSKDESLDTVENEFNNNTCEGNTSSDEALCDSEPHETSTENKQVTLFR